MTVVVCVVLFRIVVGNVTVVVCVVVGDVIVVVCVVV